MSNDEEKNKSKDEELFSKKDAGAVFGLTLAGIAAIGAYKLMWGTYLRKAVTIAAASTMMYTTMPGCKQNVDGAVDKISNWYKTTFVDRPLEQKVNELEGQLNDANQRASTERQRRESVESERDTYKSAIARSSGPREPRRPQIVNNTTNNYISSGEAWAVIPPGSSLSIIAEQITGNPGNYTRIANASGITDPDNVVAGEIVQIPDGLILERSMVRYDSPPSRFVILGRHESLEKRVGLDEANSIRAYNYSIGNNAVDKSNFAQRKVWIKE